VAVGRGGGIEQRSMCASGSVSIPILVPFPIPMQRQAFVPAARHRRDPDCRGWPREPPCADPPQKAGRAHAAGCRAWHCVPTTNRLPPPIRTMTMPGSLGEDDEVI